MPASITFGCADSGTQVPGTFSCSGEYTCVSSNNTVKCVLTYPDGMIPRSLCKLAIVDENPAPATWCCRFDMSAHLPADGTALNVSAVLIDASGAPIAGPVIRSFTYNAQAADPCTCSGAGTDC
jgi:hypothetical protein